MQGYFTMTKFKNARYHLGIFLCAIFIITTSLRAENLSVQIEYTKLRNAPQQFATSIADLHFGDVVTANAQPTNGWFQVTTSSGSRGYLHESALTKKKIVLSSQQKSLKDIAVDDSAVYLAGKGFNSDVAQNFKAKNKDANFDGVVAMRNQSQSIPDSSVRDLITTGKLFEGSM